MFSTQLLLCMCKCLMKEKKAVLQHNKVGLGIALTWISLTKPTKNSMTNSMDFFKILLTNDFLFFLSLY